MSDLASTPASATLVAWGNAWLAGHLGADEVADAAQDAHGPQVVHDPSRTPADQPLRHALSDLRAEGIDRFRLALPVPGDPLGLTGPADFTRAAVAAGEAVLVGSPSDAAGLVPEPDDRGSSYAGIRWSRYTLADAPAAGPTLAEAEQQLALTLRSTADSLVDLDVADWRPEATQALTAVRRGGDSNALPPGYPPRAHRVAAQAARLATISAVGLADDGGALTGWEADTRRTALRELERAVRRARVAAYNSVTETR